MLPESGHGISEKNVHVYTDNVWATTGENKA